MIPYFRALLRFDSQLPLREVAELVSLHLLGACPMVEDHVWGETGWHNREPVLGLMCVLHGAPAKGYWLEILPANGSECDAGEFDLGPLVKHNLAAVDAFSNLRQLGASEQTGSS